MATTRTRTNVKNFTRTDLVTDTTKRFLEIAGDHHANVAFYYDRLEVMIRMELVTRLSLIVFCEDEPIGGVALLFDWEKHQAMIASNGEFIDSGLINQYGTTDSITDTFELVRDYVSGLFKLGSGKPIGASIWYTPNDEKIREIGQTRYDQLMDIQPKSPEHERETQARWERINAVRSSREKARVSALGDLPETSIKVW